MIFFFQIPVLPELSSRNRQMINHWITKLSESELLDELDYEKTIRNLLGKIDDVFNFSEINILSNMINFAYSWDTPVLSVYVSPDTGTKKRDNRAKTTAVRIENLWKKISNFTGGSYLELTDIESSINSILSREETSYMLSYRPDSSENKSSIRITSSNRGLQLVYNTGLHTEEVDQTINNSDAYQTIVRFEDVFFKRKILSFKISDFSIRQIKQQKSGQLKVRIFVTEQGEKVAYDRTNILQAKKEKTKISINFENLKRGKYQFSLFVTDLLTGNKSTFHLRTNI